MRTNSTIDWIEIHGQAHIVQPSRYRDRTLCGKTMDEATVIMPGDDLDGCVNCITTYSEQNKSERPPMPEEDPGWPRVPNTRSSREDEAEAWK